MPVVEIDLDDTSYAQLRSAAERAGISLPDFIVRIVQDGTQSLPVDADIARATDEVIERYRPVLHRLAQ